MILVLLIFVIIYGFGATIWYASTRRPHFEVGTTVVVLRKTPVTRKFTKGRVIYIRDTDHKGRKYDRENYTYVVVFAENTDKQWRDVFWPDEIAKASKPTLPEG